MYCRKYRNRLRTVALVLHWLCIGAKLDFIHTCMKLCSEECGIEFPFFLSRQFLVFFFCIMHDVGMNVEDSEKIWMKTNRGNSSFYGGQMRSMHPRTSNLWKLAMCSISPPAHLLNAKGCFPLLCTYQSFVKKNRWNLEIKFSACNSCYCIWVHKKAYGTVFFTYKVFFSLVKLLTSTSSFFASSPPIFDAVMQTRDKSLDVRSRGRFLWGN